MGVEHRDVPIAGLRAVVTDHLGLKEVDLGEVIVLCSGQGSKSEWYFV